MYKGHGDIALSAMCPDTMPSATGRNAAMIVGTGARCIGTVLVMMGMANGHEL